PHLHPGENLAFEVYGGQDGQHEEREHGDGLAHDQPPRVGAEGGESGMVGGCQGDDDEDGGGCAHDVCAPRASRTDAPAPVARVAPTAEPGAFCGSHTTRSGMSVTAQGSVIAPRSAETVTGSPSATPISCAVADESRATGARAVPARCGSPSCIRPLSSNIRQVPRTASPADGSAAWPERAGLVVVARGGVVAAPARSVTSANSRRADSTSGRPNHAPVSS